MLWVTGHSFQTHPHHRQKHYSSGFQIWKLSYIKSTLSQKSQHICGPPRGSLRPPWLERGGWRHVEVGQAVLENEVNTRNMEPRGRRPCCSHMLNPCPPRERAPTGSFGPQKCSGQGRPVWPRSCRPPHCMPNHCSWSAHWAASLSLPSRSPSSPLPSMSSTSSS